MSKPELQMLSEIHSKIGRLEANEEANRKAITDMANSINRLVDKLDKSDDIAREADQRAKSAHHRIDETNKKVAGVQDDIRWLWRTVLAAIITGVIGGAIALLWKGVGN